MIKLANELLSKLEKADKTEGNRIAIKRVKEVIQILTAPEREKRNKESREKARLAAIDKLNKKYQGDPRLSKKLKPFIKEVV